MSKVEQKAVQSNLAVPYVVIVSDGVSLRTIHPPALGAHRAGIEAALVDVLGLCPDLGKTHVGGQSKSGPAPIGLKTQTWETSAAPRREPAKTDTMVQREIATASGYSGDACQSCGSFAMKRTGVCLTCEGCGSTSGGCS